jgi:deoxycytidine triphosphate deaminase
MFINPKYAIEQGWIQGIQNPDKQVQPNAIDFTLDTLKLLSADTARVSEDGKSMRPLVDVQLTPGGWGLEYGRVYDGTSEMYCDLPKGIAALLYTRSTLARNGVFLVSGLYDSGYQGHVGFTIYPIGGHIVIAKGTRVGQIAFVSADSAKLYAGGWNHQEGTHYTPTP